MSEEQAGIRVLCVDDHPIVRQGIAMLLSAEPDMVLDAEAANGAEAIQQFRARRPDITLMDLQMPGMSGLDAIGAIRAEFPDARILVLTTYADDVQAQRALQAGACGYLLKSALHRELLDAIRTAHGGRGVLPSPSSYALAGQVASDTLTPAEISVLRCMAQGQGYPEIARALNLDEAAVEAQVRSIRAKLDALDRTLAVKPELERAMVQTERAARHAAEAANRAKSEFLADMNYELRTPLNAVLGYAQLLTLDGGLNPRQARGLDVIQQGAQDLLALVNDILDLARIEAGRVELNPQPLSLSASLQAVLALMRAKADDKRLALVLDAAADLPEAVLADERRLRQVLMTLLGHAIDFTDSGSVTLRARAEPRGPARVLLRLDVEDTGLGLHRDDLERLFTPFEPPGRAGQPAAGTGLGLPICRHLARLMDGDIAVQSQPGAGSTFSFAIEVPLCPAARARPADAPPIGYEGERRRVLVIGAAAAGRALLVDILAPLGFLVTDGADGLELLERAAPVAPDLVIADIGKAEVEDLAALRRLRSAPATARLPVIATSASATPETAARGLAAGAHLFLPHPIDRAALLDAIAALLGLRWVRGLPPTAAAGPAANGDADLVAPPADELELLLDLARRGDMRSIARRADHLKTLDPRHAAFAARLHGLAERYEAKAVLDMVEHFCRR